MKRAVYGFFTTHVTAYLRRPLALLLALDNILNTNFVADDTLAWTYYYDLGAVAIC